MDDAFAPMIDASWRRICAGERMLQDDPLLYLACSDDLDEGEEGMLLQPFAGPARAVLRPVLAERLQLYARAHWTLAQLRQRLIDVGQRTHGADRLFYFPAAELAALAEHPAPPHIRRLAPADTAVFSAFQASASKEDLDAAWVELDHWQVFGAFDGEQLVAAGSLYPWSLDPALADMGVLTLPEPVGAVMHAGSCRRWPYPPRPPGCSRSTDASSTTRPPSPLPNAAACARSATGTSSWRPTDAATAQPRKQHEIDDHRR